MKSHVAQLLSPRKLVWIEEDIPIDCLGLQDVACETLYTAISPGTELAAYEGAPALRPGTAYPRYVGYCNAARVVAAGKEVTRLRTGDMVLTFSSHRSRFVVHEEKIVSTIPQHVSAREACVTYLFHLGYQACRRGGVVAGHNVAVLGLGALGLTSVAMSALAGARVFGISDHDAPRTLAIRYGAELALARRDVPHSLSSAVSEAGIDVLITTSNSWNDWLLGLETVRFGGVISVLGFPGRTEGAPGFNPLASDKFYYKQLTIVSVGAAPSLNAEAKDLRFTEKRNMAYLLNLEDTGRLDTSHIISSEYNWDRLNDAYEDLLARSGSPVTFVLKWNE